MEWNCQTLRDLVILFNLYGPDGLAVAPPKLDPRHRAFLGRMVEKGPIPAVHGVVRWRACDLMALVLLEAFGVSVLMTQSAAPCATWALPT